MSWDKTELRTIQLDKKNLKSCIELDCRVKVFICFMPISFFVWLVGMSKNYLYLDLFHLYSFFAGMAYWLIPWNF